MKCCSVSFCTSFRENHHDTEHHQCRVNNIQFKLLELCDHTSVEFTQNLINIVL